MLDIICVRLILLIALCLGLPSLSLAQPGDDTFLAARDAYNARDLRKLDTLAVKLTDHPLAVYVAYWQFSSRIGSVSPTDVRAFLTRYADTPLAERLRVEWLKELGRQKSWETLNDEYPKLVNADTEVTCYALQGKLALNGTDISKEGHAIWFSAKTSPDSCAPVFDQMMTSGTLSAEDVWRRIRLALNANNVTLAKQLNEHVLALGKINEKALDTANTAPQHYLERNSTQLGNRASREIVIFALIRLARSQSAIAADYLKDIAPHLPAKDAAYAWGQIAYYGALSHNPNVLAWYDKASQATLSDNQIAWRIRSALRMQNWPEVLSSIDQLSSNEQRESNWRYWKARALKATGKAEEATDILLPLSRETHFYGLLAGEELGPTLSNPTVIWKPGDQDIANIRQVPGIRRALFLKELQMTVEALREWSMVTRGLDDRQLLSAAEVASKAGWIDRAIFTADRTKELHDYSLRFPTPFRDALKANAIKYQLDEAWVYGLIRQESRFITEAQSPVGARGLMQVMPATARWIAKKLGIKNLRDTQISDVNTNIALGTFYMRNVLDSLGHPVLATAGYNAGPGRARRWRGLTALEGAIYTESIPLTETRDYVKKVMTNATLYALQLGLTPHPLKERLGVIGGQTTTTVEDSNLEPATGS